MKTAVPALRKPFDWREGHGITWIQAQLPDAVAAYTTRAGGVSEGTYAGLNLGMKTDDDPALVARNRDLVATAVGRDPHGFAIGLQVHGRDVQVSRRRPERSPYVHRGAKLHEADAQLTDSRDVTPIVLTADCLPLVLSAPGAVAAVHCGWRGIAAGIVETALAALGRIAGAAPRHVSAVLGPAIGGCCYEVGDEVLAAFERRGLEQAIDGRMLDIAAAVRGELTRAGVDQAAIADAGICTACNAELFFSHRRDGPTGRQAAVAWLT